jgi:hypothetical protein
MRGALLPFHELTEHERQFIIDELTKDTAVRRLNVSNPVNEAEFDKLLLAVLNEWGVMCPHPQLSTTETAYGHYCATCGCDVISFNNRKLSGKMGL